MATKTMSAWEARRNFGKLLDEVRQNRNSVIIERHGEPAVAFVPLSVLKHFEELEERVFSAMEEAAARTNMSEDEAMAFANALVAEVRAEEARRRSAAD